MWDPYVDFESAVLPNGLSVHACKWDRAWATIGFLVHTGARHDPVGLEGLAHYIEHLVSQNAIVPSKEINSFFDGSGGSAMLGSTGYLTTKYSFFAPAEKEVLARALDIFGSMLIEANLRNFVERERQVIMREFFREYPAKAKIDLATREVRAVYAGSWRERFLRPLGSPESVKRITGGDLQEHYDANYTPANISVVCVGGVGLSELIDLLNASPFGKKKQGVRTPLPAKEVSVPLPLETRYLFEISKVVRTDVPSDVGAYRSVVRLPGAVNLYALQGVSEVLNKLLFEEVREKRAWTYHIDCGVSNHIDAYEFSINCGALDPKALGGIEAVVERCLTEVGEREDLLRSTQKEAVRGIWMQDPNGRQLRDAVIYDLERHQRIVSLPEMEEGIMSVTADDLRDALQWLRPERRWTMISQP